MSRVAVASPDLAAAPPANLRRVIDAVLLCAIGLAIAARVALACVGQPLWADEIFSLAMATGHSLEHPANAADTRLGDYVESPRPQPASYYRAYLVHERPAEPVGRVLRAVTKSDTSPPLYDLVLYVWTRLLGTSDRALRMLSVIFAVASFPVLWSVARQIASSRRAAIVACVLYAAAPVAFYYAAEGRVYAIVWFLALVQAWATLSLHRHGPQRPGVLVLWIVAAATGLMCHYFYVFVLAAMTLWLLIYPGRLRRWHVVAAAMIAGALVMPWFARVPALAREWRVTNSWINHPWTGQHWSVSALHMAWAYVSCYGPWGKNRVESAAYVLWAVVVVVSVWHLRRRLVSPRMQLAWLWMMAACIGPMVFDLVQWTYTATIDRYALAGMPAALILAGAGLGAMGWRLRYALVALIVLVWLPPDRRILTNASRVESSPFRQLAQQVDRQAQPGDLVIIHSIPSGVLGVARYMTSGTPIYSWVPWLNQRQVPGDIARIIAGYRRIILIKVHWLDSPAPEEQWLEQNLLPQGPPQRVGAARVYRYQVTSGSNGQ